MAYDLYVLNQRLPRFVLREGCDYPSDAASQVDAAFSAWITESIVGNLQRRKACSQVFDFAAAMEAEGHTLEILTGDHYALFLADRKMPALCRFADFLVYARKRLPFLQWA